MIEGTFKYHPAGADRWTVESDIITGKMVVVGSVWSAPPWSIEAKRRRWRREWWSRVRTATCGPFATRKAAANSLT